jgi:hypothetical protein
LVIENLSLVIEPQGHLQMTNSQSSRPNFHAFRHGFVSTDGGKTGDCQGSFTRATASSAIVSAPEHEFMTRNMAVKVYTSFAG